MGLAEQQLAHYQSYVAAKNAAQNSGQSLEQARQTAKAQVGTSPGSAPPIYKSSADSSAYWSAQRDRYNAAQRNGGTFYDALTQASGARTSAQVRLYSLRNQLEDAKRGGSSGGSSGSTHPAQRVSELNKEIKALEAQLAAERRGENRGSVINSLTSQMDELKDSRKQSRWDAWTYLDGAENNGADVDQELVKSLEEQLAAAEAEYNKYNSEYESLTGNIAAYRSREDARAQGMNSMEWYDSVQAEADSIQAEMDKLYKELNAAQAQAQDILGDSGMTGIGGSWTDYLDPERAAAQETVADLEGRIMKLMLQQDKVLERLGYAEQYRFEDAETAPAGSENSAYWSNYNLGNNSVTQKGKELYLQNRGQWYDELERNQASMVNMYDPAGLGQLIQSYSIDQSYREPTPDWTEEERNRFYYLLGNYPDDSSKAYEYAEQLNNRKQAEKNQEKANDIAEKATDNVGAGALHTVLATGAGLASGMEYAWDVMEYAARGTVTEKEFGLADYSNAVTTAISSTLNDKYGTIGGDGILAGKGLGDVYQIAQSVGQSWAAMALTGGSVWGVNAMFFGQAAKSTLDQQLAKGADPSKAIAYGALSGVAEVLGETLSLENIKAFRGGFSDGIIKDVLRSGFIEGSEEGMTTALNTIFDKIVNGDESDYYVALSGYVAQGMSYDEARKAAMKDWIKGISFDVLAGSVSGAMGAAPGNISAGIYNATHETSGDYQSLIDKGIELGVASAKAMDGRSGKPTIQATDKLAKEVEKAQGEFNIKQVKNAVRAELKNQGVTEKLDTITNAIYKSARGRMMNSEEAEAFKATAGAVQLRDDLKRQMYDAGLFKGKQLDTAKLQSDKRPEWLKNTQVENGKEMVFDTLYGKAIANATEADTVTELHPTVKIGSVEGTVSGLAMDGSTPMLAIKDVEGKTVNVSVDRAIKSGKLPDDLAQLAFLSSGQGEYAMDIYSMYSDGQSIREYVPAMDDAINIIAPNVKGREAFDKSPALEVLTDEQKDYAWEKGRQKRTKAIESEGKKKETSSQPKKKKPQQKGKVSYGGAVRIMGENYQPTDMKKVKPADLRVIKKLAETVGVDVVFYETRKDASGDYRGANGFYKNGTIYLDVNAGLTKTNQQNAILLTAAHELTHHIRANAPAQYRELKEFVTEVLSKEGFDFNALVKSRQKQDGKLSNEDAVEEVVADACEMVLGDSKAIEKLAKEKPSLHQQIADWLREFFADIKAAFEGVQAVHEEAKAMMKYMDELTALWDAGLVETAKADSVSESNVGGKEVKTSLRQFEDGRKFVDVNVEQKQFDGLNHKEIASLAAKIIKSKFANKVIGIDNKVFVNGRSAAEYGFPVKKLDEDVHSAKMRASTELDNLLDAGTNFRTHPDGKDGHVHLQAVGDFQYFDTIFKVGKEYYKGVINIMPVKKGLLFKDITDLKNITQDISSSYGQSPKSTFLRDASMDSIREENGNVNSKSMFSPRSIQGLTREEAQAQSQAYTRMKAENASLQRQVEHWKSQTQKSKGAKVRRSDTDKYANELLRHYGSKADKRQVQELMYELGNYLMQSPGDKLNYNTLRRKAENIAELILDNAQENAIYYENMTEADAKELQTDIKSKWFDVDEMHLAGLPEGFKREYRNVIHITTDSSKGQSVNSIYEELRSGYGYELFPAELSSPVEQLIRIADVYDLTHPQSFNPYEKNMNEFIMSTAFDIMDHLISGEIRPADRATAKLDAQKSKDRQKLDAQKSKDRQKLDALRSEKNARIEQLKRQESLKRQEAVAKEKAAKWEKYDAVKAYYQNQAKEAHQRRKESAAGKKYRERIYSNAEKLMNWLIRNSEKEHIPEALKQPVRELLETIDFRSKSQVKGKGTTQRDMLYTEKLEKIARLLDDQRSEDSKLDSYMDMPDGFPDEIRDHIESVKAILSGRTDIDMSDPVSVMTSDQLRELDKILRVLTTSIQKLNKFHSESRYADAIAASKSSVAEMKGLGQDMSRGVLRQLASNYMKWDNAVPVYVFKRFGVAGYERFVALADGWGKMAKNVKEVIKFTEDLYTDKEVRDWESATHEIKLSNGETVTMTEAQMMGLYCLAKREQGKAHLLVGGIRVEDITLKGLGKKKISQPDNYHLTQDDISAIAGQLSKRQLEVADKLQNFMNTVCAEWGNYVSMERFGYKQFTERNYYPIRTNPNNHPVQNLKAQENDIMRLLNMSFTRALTPNANNSVVINSIFDVFSAHAMDMAKYNALALPILDMMKWYNYKDKSYQDVQDSQGNTYTQISVRSVQSTVEEVFGKAAQNYIVNFLKDLNGTRDGGRGEGVFKKITGNAKAAAVSLNLRVAIQQPTSIARASYMIDAKYLIRGMTMRGGAEEAQKYSGHAVWKTLGFFDTNLALSAQEQIKHSSTALDKVRDKGTILAERADQLTWGAIWNACKLEVSERQGLTGEALMEATRKRFDEIILHTQVMDSTITRSDMMRNRNGLISELTNFMSEPTLTYNMLLDSAMEFNAVRRRTGNINDARREAGSKIFKAISVFAVSQALTAVAAAIVDAMRDDDEYQTFMEKWLEHSLENYKGNLNPLKLVPGIADGWDLIWNREEPTLMMWQTISQVMDSARLVVNPLLVAVGLKEPEEGSSGRTRWGKLYTAAQGLSALSGVPVASAIRDFKAVWNNTVGAAFSGKSMKMRFYDPGVRNSVKYGLQDGYVTEDEAIGLLLESGEYTEVDDAYWQVQEWLHAEDSEWTRYDALNSAMLSGDSKAFDTAFQDLQDHGLAASSIRSSAKGQIGKWFLNLDEKGNLDQIMDKTTVLKALQDYAGLTAMEAQHQVDKWQLELTHGITYSDISTEYINGNISENEAVNWQMKYGHVYEQAAKENVRKWKCEKETGIKFDDLSEAYINDDISQQETVSYLEKYGDYSREDAEGKVLQWQLAKDYGISYSSSTEGIKAAFIQDYIPMETAITIMQVYGGKPREEAEDYAYQYLFTKETGYNWSDGEGAVEAFKDGALTEEELAYWYDVASINTHGDDEKSWEYVEVARWKRDVPGAERMNRSGLEKWESRRSSLAGVGLYEEDFAKVWDIYSTSEAEYDENGNQTRERAQVVMERIGQLQGYNRNQLTQLGYALYKSKTVNHYKTW